MTEQTWIDGRVDRSKWGPGEWDGEPDKVQWTDELTGLVCLAKRHPTSGNWCGYVGVDSAHPWHGKGYGDAVGPCTTDCDRDENGEVTYHHYGHRIDGMVEVHGGLTFADNCQEGPPEETICHVPAPGEPDGLWWFGFDCHHAWDLAPGDLSLMDRNSTYRTLAYVKRECARLAQQIAAVKS